MPPKPQALSQIRQKLPTPRFFSPPDVLLLVALYAFTYVSVLAAAGLLYLSVPKFWHAFQIGKKNAAEIQDYFAPQSGIQPDSAPVEAQKQDSTLANQNLVHPTHRPKTPEQRAEIEAVTSTLHGIEFVLLAPLAYLLVRSLMQFCIVKFDLLAPPDGYTAWHTGDASASLTEVKALIVSLLGGVVAVHLVGQVIDEDLTPQMWLEILVLVVLIAYYFGLDYRAGSQRTEGHHLASALKPPPTPGSSPT